jgi:predicted small lipoprotein YifL
LTGRNKNMVPIAILVGTLVLAGCGVKGPLEPPPGTAQTASPNPLQTTVVPDRAGDSVTSTQTQTATSKEFTSKAGKDEPGKKKRFKQGNVPISTEPVKPDRPFILDDLL